jgi:ABC-type uncharacterized transport system substrate-binding protein
MKHKILSALLPLLIFSCGAENKATPDKKTSPTLANKETTKPTETPQTKTQIRIVVVSSYHREYLWSQDTNRGFCAAMQELGYFRDQKDCESYTATDAIETPKAVVKKIWMDTKRKNDEASIAQATADAVKVVKDFNPDILLLGDDNAANYVGNQFLDTKLPIVFWGVNGYPVKYGLIDSIEKPGHNVTGVYQAGYKKETLEFLQKLAPSIKTIAILSDDSETARVKIKELEAQAAKGELPVSIVGKMATNSYAEWQKGALDLATKADAFFVFNHNTLKDEAGKPVDQMVAGAWYLENIKKPDCGDEAQFVKEGILATADDSGYNQGYEAMKLAEKILKGESPANIAVYAPKRGAYIVNRQRAQTLGLPIPETSGAEEFIEDSVALKKPATP